MKTIAKLILLFLLSAPFAAAQSKPTTAGDLYKTCTSKSSRQSGECDGYIQGWTEAIDGTIIELGSKFYAVGVIDSTVAAQRAAFVQFVKEHPEAKDRDARVVVLLALGNSKLAFLSPVDTETAPKEDKPL